MSSIILGYRVPRGRTRYAEHPVLYFPEGAARLLSPYPKGHTEIFNESQPRTRTDMKYRAILFLVCLAASLAAKPVLADDAIYGDSLPPGAVARLGTTRMRHLHSSRVVFSPDSRWVATMSNAVNIDVRLWDTATGKQWLPAVTDKLSQEKWMRGTVFFSEDGKSLRFVDLGASVRKLDLQTGELRGTEQKILAPPSSLLELGAVSQQGNRLVFKRKGHLIIYDIGANEEVVQIGPLEDHSAIVSVAFDGSVVAIVHDGKMVKVWNGNTGEYIWQYQAGFIGNQNLGISRDGKLIAIPLQDREFAVFDPFTGKEILHGSAEVRASSFSPDGQRLATISPFGDVHVWEIASGEEVVKTKVPSSSTHSIEFSPDGKTLAVVASGGTVWLLDAASGKSRLPDAVHVEEVKRVALSADGKRVLSSSERNMILWNAEEQTSLFVTSVLGPSIALSPDGKRVTARSTVGMLSFFNSDSGVMTSMEEISRHSQAIEYSPDGRYLAVPGAGDVHAIAVIDFSSNSRARAMTTSGNPVSCAWFADGKRLAGGTSDGTVRIWQTSDMREIAALDDRQGNAVVDLAVHPSGEFLATIVASSGGAGSPRLWSITTRKPLGAHRFKSILDSRGLTRIQFSPDGEIIAAVAADRSLRLWSWKTGQLLAEIGAEQDGVFDVDFSRDGTRMVTAGRDSTLLIWDLAALLSQRR
jgi:WD40 repeat protein